MAASQRSFKYCPRCATELRTTPIDGRERPTCACGFVAFDNPTPVVAALVESPEGVVLVRGHAWPPGWFGLVTGFIERNELPTGAVLREVREELGVDAELQGLIGHYIFEAKNELIIAYHVRITVPVQLGEELEASRTVPVSELKPWGFGTGLAVADWLRARVRD